MICPNKDVVPVEPSTFSDWVHPPYSGHYDGTYVWGRGSNDDKSGLIGILAAIESLLALPEPFQPKRSIVLAFGNDEESAGLEGAGALNDYILQRWGEDSMAMIVDEGGGYAVEGGKAWATPGVSKSRHCPRYQLGFRQYHERGCV